MYDRQHFAFVITHVGPRNDIVEMPWLETDYRVDESDSVVLSEEGWRAVADGDRATWDALERKLLLGSYTRQSQLILVVGHPSDAGDDDRRRADVRRIARRIESLLLPATVVGIWAAEPDTPHPISEPAAFSECERAELQPVL